MKKVKKKAKYILFGLIGIVVISLMSFLVLGESDASDDLPLLPPQIDITGDILAMNPSNSLTPSSYDIYVDGVFYINTAQTKYDLSAFSLEKGAYLINVVSILKGERSELSETVRYYCESEGDEEQYLTLSVGDKETITLLYEDMSELEEVKTRYVVWEFLENEGVAQVVEESEDEITFEALKVGTTRFCYMTHAIMTDGYLHIRPIFITITVVE